jgi:cell wall-associated NlpC family hydrolase
MKKLILVLLMLVGSTNAFALSEMLKVRVEKELYFLMSKDPFSYTWGAADPFNGKADCSGVVYAIFAKRLQIPVARTTALEMSMNLKGWNHKEVKVDELDSTDVVWFSWSESAAKRPMGHIGLMILSPRSGLIELAHASSSKKKFTVEPLKGKFLTDLSRSGRFTFGEPKATILGKGIIKTSPDTKK